MPKKIEPPELFQRGDIVLVRLHPHMKAKVIELRGQLGPNGEEVYRIRFGKSLGGGQAEVLPHELRLLRRAALPAPTVPPPAAG